jgi:hypothetical protein
MNITEMEATIMIRTLMKWSLWDEESMQSIIKLIYFIIFILVLIFYYKDKIIVKYNFVVKVWKNIKISNFLNLSSAHGASFLGGNVDPLKNTRLMVQMIAF